MKTKHQYSEKNCEQTVELCDLILFNDDVNTFDFVTETLIEVCGHEYIQAVQCTHIVHFNGKCSVKRGSFEKLRPVCETLVEKGLSAQIQ
ncbi:MAG TPA: ATP-dependent Clp protease adaptor ClpS [Bacteroidia bacterium]